MGVVHSGHAERLLEVVQGALGLRVLLGERVVQDDFVSLYQALAVLLPMLQLLVSITLNPFQECSQCQLLRMAQLRLLLLDDGLHLCLQFVPLEFFQQVSFHLDPLGFIVAFHADQFGLAVSQLEQILRELHFLLEFLPDFVLELLELKHVFLLELLERKIGSCFVITHVVVPCLGEFEELGLLGGFNILQFLLLGCADVVLLPNGLLPQQLIKLSACFLRLLIITLNFALFPVLLQEPKEI